MINFILTTLVGRMMLFTWTIMILWTIKLWGWSMFDKEAYLKELRLQLEYVDTVEDYEEIMETIRYLEDGDLAEDY